MLVEVLCVGHASYDLVVPLPHFPRENAKYVVESVAESGGGPAANAAWLLSSWGANCAFAGVLGEDPDGDRILDEFRQIGTDTSLLKRLAGHPTPLSLIVVNQTSGSRTIVNRRQPAPPGSLDLSKASFAPRVLLFDGHELDASLAALERWPDATSILDAGSVRTGTLELAGRVDYLVSSETFSAEASEVGDMESEAHQRDAIRNLRARFDTCVAVTLGERGVVWDFGAGYQSLPAFPAKVVDTTGAGDIFHGAFAFALLRGQAPAEALRFASLTAALSVSRPGGRASIPTREQVEEALSHAKRPL